MCMPVDEVLKAARAEEERVQQLLDLSEDEYEGLPLYQQQEIEAIRYARKVERLERYQNIFLYYRIFLYIIVYYCIFLYIIAILLVRRKKEKEERERIERERREEELRMEEEKSKKKRGVSKHHDPPGVSPAHAAGPRPDSAQQGLPTMPSKAQLPSQLLSGVGGASGASVSSNADSIPKYVIVHIT